MESISIIVTACNCAGLIRQALRSVSAAVTFFQQEQPGAWGVPLEVVVVDDGSTDGTDQVVLDCVRETGLGRLVRNDGPTSPSCARNVGVAHSTGALLFFLDGDDLFLPGHIHTCYRALQESGTDYVKTAVRLADPVHPDWRTRIEFSVAINLCIRRACHDFVGGFPDYHLFQRGRGGFQQRADIFYKIEDLFYNRLVHELFRGTKVAAETVEYCRYPGNSYDRQYAKFQRPFGEYREVLSPERQLGVQLGRVITEHLLARLEQQRELAANGAGLYDLAHIGDALLAKQ